MAISCFLASVSSQKHSLGEGAWHPITHPGTTIIDLLLREFAYSPVPGALHMFMCSIYSVLIFTHIFTIYT